MLNTSLYIDRYIPEYHDHLIRVLEDVRGSVLFVNNLAPIKTDLPIFDGVEIWQWHDRIIADSFISARYLYQCPVPREKLLLIQWADWHEPGFYAVDRCKVYKNIPIICFSKQIELAMQDIWGVNATLYEDFIDVVRKERTDSQERPEVGGLLQESTH